MESRTIPLSLCIPTNGMTKWVIPVLDSIYGSSVDEQKYEVVIEDNGNNKQFEETVSKYMATHSNLKYYKSESQGFLCQIDSFKNARGEFIKFINHRTKLVEGALEYLVQYAEENILFQPVSFFSDGKLDDCSCSSFDEFVRNMSYWSSWSGGLAFWKKDISLITEQESYNTLFPHTDMLFIRKDAENYRIINRKLFSETETRHASKGKYNLFRAFAVEYPAILCELVRKDAISTETFLEIKNKLKGFLADMYIQFIIRREPASYSFEKYWDYLQVFYSKREIEGAVTKRLIRGAGSRVNRVFRR